MLTMCSKFSIDSILDQCGVGAKHNGSYMYMKPGHDRSRDNSTVWT